MQGRALQSLAEGSQALAASAPRSCDQSCKITTVAKSEIVGWPCASKLGRASVSADFGAGTIVSGLLSVQSLLLTAGSVSV